MRDPKQRRPSHAGAALHLADKLRKHSTSLLLLSVSGAPHSTHERRRWPPPPQPWPPPPPRPHRIRNRARTPRHGLGYVRCAVGSDAAEAPAAPGARVSAECVVVGGGISRLCTAQALATKHGIGDALGRLRPAPATPDYNALLHAYLRSG
ncbi:hypothetical protein E2562_035654 [Oryza meyeriana var. granulata]|uniref:Uncharacterized protein n=1 Tax=Oryza meyeriana var. granulata TaxID=110450 RepID=A0A6G1FFE9_9ORYZ|nr:hypothetical protein E2562_035654 [Oryza meyeriana var. granulata]